MGAHALAYYVLDQITRNNVNTDANNDGDSQSIETPWKNNCSSTYFVIQRLKLTKKICKTSHIWKYVFQTKVKTFRAAQCAK